jgi:hypothetical protein
MDELWWSCNEISQDDTGEDVLVKIFDEPDDGARATGSPSGLHFLAQVKSIADHEARVGALFLTYRFKVCDLREWEDSMPPVVLVVWDVSNRTGFWSIASDACLELDSKDPMWREQQTTTVTLPLRNTFAEDGASRLRPALADKVLPAYSRGRPIEMKMQFSFPKSQEGAAAAQAIREVVDLGKPAVIRGEFVKHVAYPEWFERLYGGGLGEVSEVQIKPQAPDTELVVELVARAPGVLV